MRLPTLSRTLVAIAALLLGALYVVPLWRIDLGAPQYPEGLGMLIHINTIVGQKTHDLASINSLNRYIGMRPIEPDAIPELQWMPWILGGMIAFGLVAAAAGRRRLLVAWLASLVAVGAAGLYDFWRWGHDYGHNLDQTTAIIKMPGMTYSPPVIGTKQLLNFTATSLPATGAWLAALAFALGVLALWLAWRPRESRQVLGTIRQRVLGAAAAAIVLVLGACTTTPEPIRHGDDDCERCPMLMAGARFDAAGVGTRPAGATRAPAGDTIVVSPRGPITTITAGLAAARDGGAVVVTAGTYREPTIVIERPVTLIGRGAPVLDGEGERAILAIRADDVAVRGLAFRNVGASEIEDRAAIRISGAARCAIEDNELADTFFGIALEHVETCRIAGNRLRGTGGSEAMSGNGIHVWSSRDITIDDNHITGHRDGIYLEFAHESRIRRNVAEGNVRYGLHFMFSDDSRYEENVFRRNQAGVAVMYTRRVVMTGNRFEGNWGAGAYGLLLKEISDAEVRGNHFERNTTALLADGANRLLAAENRFAGNGWALRLMASSGDARIERNDFIGNTFDVVTNSRTTYSTFAGNYWDGYRGYDLDRDGVGDLPHRPMRLFSQIVERFEPTLILQRSFLVGLLDTAERVLPSLTPEGLLDPTPSMRPIR